MLAGMVMAGERLIYPGEVDRELEDAIRAYRDCEPAEGKPSGRRERRSKRVQRARSKAHAADRDDALAPLAKVVKRRLREAGRTLRGIQLPRDYAGLRNIRVCWPEIRRRQFDDETPISTPILRPRPTPDQIDRLDECLGWLLWLDREGRMLIGAWMIGRPRAELAAEIGASRWTAMRRVEAVCLAIAGRLVLRSVSRE